MVWIVLAVAMGIVIAAPVGAGEAKLLTGDVWQKMSKDEKVAFIWGAGQVVTIEQAIMDKLPEMRQETFSAKVVEGMADTDMNQVVTTIDGFYAANPDKLDTAVFRVIWDEMIRPNIRTGIGGRPLQ
ncbi:conserved uncharacterized protein [Desulfococcus multivorans]|jgi:hypothetical protein|nr:conserved uncharacterized protein [Desulfococcus multivorans]